MPAKILYIEDEPMNVRLLHRMLKFSGYEVTVAETGIDGIYQAQRVQPDLILLDLNLPDIDGIEVARRIRQQPSLTYVPIVVLSARSSLQARREAFLAGCDSYITKPTSRVELLRTLHQYLTYIYPAQADLEILEVS